MITGFNNNFKSDLSFGMAGEQIVLPKLRTFFQKDIRKESAKYCKWDYIDENGTLYELKTRRVMSTSYPTTMLPVHKVVDGKEQYFVFNFTDKVMYIKYDKKKFESYTINGSVDGRFGYQRDAVPHYYIPVGDLLTIS